MLYVVNNNSVVLWWAPRAGVGLAMGCGSSLPVQENSRTGHADEVTVHRDRSSLVWSHHVSR